MPEMKDVKSEMMQKVGHEGEDLYVEFAPGAVYKYWPVTKAEYQEMIESDSVGKWFAKNIKGEKEFEKVDDGRK